MRSFRQLLWCMLPYWARDDEAGGAFAYTLSTLTDISLQRMRSGLDQQFPSRAGPTALGIIGKDRLILRGRDETDGHYAGRLASWRYPRGHRIRGSVFALLEQISEYFGGDVALDGIDRSGNLRSRAADGTETYQRSYSWTWDDGAASSWSRQWIVIKSCTALGYQPAFGDPALWGGAYGTEGHCIGIRGSSARDWDAIRSLLRGQHRWLPAGVQPEWLCVMLSDDPLTPDDASWSKWGKLVVTDYVPARATEHRYIALRDELRVYAGDNTVWANRAITSLGTFSGDDTSWPASVTLPDGRDYAGDPTSWPATIDLPDDGSLPA